MPLEGDSEAIAKTLRAGRAGVPRDLARVGTELVSRLRLKLTTPGTGVLYTQKFATSPSGGVYAYGKRVPHRASAPGEPPARDTGRLAASVSKSVERLSDGAVLSVGSSLEHAVYTEYGTSASPRRHSTVAPRPWLRPVMAESHKIITYEVSSGIEGRQRAQARRLGGKG